MEPQLWIFFLYLALALLIAGVFALVARNAAQGSELSAAALKRWRISLFALLVTVLATALGLTLARMPYDAWSGEIPEHTVFVAGKQFAFAVSEDPIDSDEQWEEETLYSEVVEVRAEALVEFRVTSLDVNHSMGLYDPQGTLIGQVQGMPGYVNRLRMRFARPGRYRILCLELCGNGHSRMRGVFDVLGSGTAAGGGAP